MDETGLSTVPIRTPKVLTPKGKRNVCKISSADRGETVTAVCCMSATGVFVPPALIFPRKRNNPLLFKDAPPGTLDLVTETGYMNSDLFLDWLKHFVHHVKPVSYTHLDVYKRQVQLVVPQVSEGLEPLDYSHNF